MKPRFEVYRSGLLRLWRWRLRAANGEIIASGEGFRHRIDCLHSIALVQGLAPDAPVKML